MEELDLNSFYDGLFLDDIETNIPEPTFTNYKIPKFSSIDVSSLSIPKENLEQTVNPKLTPEQQDDLIIQGELNKLKDSTKNSNYLGEASISELQRYADPRIGYHPNLNNEELYAAVNPASFSKAVAKAYYTGKSTVFYGLERSLEQLKDFSTGNWGKLWNNEAGKEMADMFLDAELENPLYYSQNDSEAGKLFYDTLAASGSMVGSIVDGLAAGVVTSLIGSAIGAPQLGLAKLANNVIGGTIKYTQAVRKMKELSDTALKVKNVAQAEKVRKKLSQASRTLLSTHLTVTGEATLQAELNKRNFEDSAIQDFYKKNGHYPSPEDMKKISEEANNLYNTTYVSNAALVGLSTFLQIPAIMKGKVTDSFMSNSLFKVVDGKVVPKNKFKIAGKDIIKDALSEGSEEFLQSVIDNATTDYYKKRVEGKEEKVLESMGIGFTKTLEHGGLREALIGAILGGGMSTAGNVRNVLNSNVDKVIEGFNKNTEEIKNYLREDIKLNNRLTNDLVQDRNTLDAKVSNMAKISYQNQVHHNRRDFIEQMKDIPLDEFESEFGIKLTEEQRDGIVTDMLRQFDNTISIMEDTEAYFQINPILDDPAFKKAVATTFADYTGINTRLSNQLFHDLKEIYINASINNQILGDELKTLQSELTNKLHQEIKVAGNVVGHIADEVANMIFDSPRELTKNINEFIALKKKGLPTNINTKGVIVGEDSKLIEKLEGVNNSYDKLITILDHYKMSEETLQNIGQYLKVYNSKLLFEDEIEELRDPQRQKEKFKEILQYKEFIYNRTKENIEEEKIKAGGQETPKSKNTNKTKPTAKPTGSTSTKAKPKTQTKTQTSKTKQTQQTKQTKQTKKPKSKVKVNKNKTAKTVKVVKKTSTTASNITQQEFQEALDEGINSTSSLNELKNSLFKINKTKC